MIIARLRHFLCIRRPVVSRQRRIVRWNKQVRTDAAIEQPGIGVGWRRGKMLPRTVRSVAVGSLVPVARSLQQSHFPPLCEPPARVAIGELAVGG